MDISIRFPKGKPKALTFSYDDGVEQDIRLMEILDRHNMKGTFNINSGNFAPEGTVYPEDEVFRSITKSMAEKAYKNHEVAVHTLTHPHLENLSREECTKEIYEDRVNLEALTGKIVKGMAYPYGTYNENVIEVLKEQGIVYARGVNSTENFELPTDWLQLEATCDDSNPRLMELAELFTKLQVPYDSPAKLFYLWGHAFAFDKKDNWHVIEEFAEYMADKEDIWYATNIEIYDYIEKFNLLQFNAEKSMCYNPTDEEIFFTAKNRLLSVKSGETIRL